MSDVKERREEFSDYLNELYSREMSNSKDYDKAILTLSTAVLGISLAFIKDVVPLATASKELWLYASWGLFALSIVIVIVSYLVSQIAIYKQVGVVNKYISDEDEEIYTYNNKWGKVTTGLNFSSGIIFVVAIGLTVAFVIMNMQGVSKMTSTSDLTREMCAEQCMPLPVLPKLQTEERGAPIPVAPKPPKKNSQQSSSGGQGGGGGQGSGGSSSSSGSSNKK